MSENTNPYQAPETSLDTPDVTQSVPEGEPSGLGGWLILVGLGIVLAPIRLATVFLQTYVPIFRDGTWEVITTPGTEAYHSMWGPLLIFEIVGNLAFLCAFIYMIVLFFRKARLFPKFYITVIVLNLLFILADSWFASFIFVDEPILDPRTSKEIARSIVGICIWVPYMLMSLRVKNTFVK